MIRSFRRGVICSLWLPQSRVLACGNLECMPCSDDYGGWVGGGPVSLEKKNLPRVSWSVVQSVTKKHCGNESQRQKRLFSSLKTSITHHKSVPFPSESHSMQCILTVAHSGIWILIGLKCGRQGGLNKTLSNCLPALALLARAVFFCLFTLNANTPTPTTVRASLASARTPLKPPLARLLE